MFNNFQTICQNPLPLNKKGCTDNDIEIKQRYEAVHEENTSLLQGTQ
jgi:hypothetical protein